MHRSGLHWTALQFRKVDSILPDLSALNCTVRYRIALDWTAHHLNVLYQTRPRIITLNYDGISYLGFSGLKTTATKD